jgi:hypothetical protein
MGTEVSFGDHVRIADTEGTRAGGWAGRDGHCWGITTPSVTGIEVVGGSQGDLALNVHFDEEALPDAWFHPDLVEYVDHAAGTEATAGDARFIRDDGGDWLPVEKDGPQ